MSRSNVTARALVALSALLAPALAMAGLDEASRWPAALDLVLMAIVAASIAYLLYDARASRRSRQARQQREELWQTRSGYHRRAPDGSHRTLK
ncbi:MAG TPA: hypothetical protein VM074_07660 [Solimonas sp.]|nr:hypothetical protein [Solimonas sp.]